MIGPVALRTLWRRKADSAYCMPVAFHPNCAGTSRVIELVYGPNWRPSILPATILEPDFLRDYEPVPYPDFTEIASDDWIDEWIFKDGWEEVTDGERWYASDALGIDDPADPIKVTQTWLGYVGEEDDDGSMQIESFPIEGPGRFKATVFTIPDKSWQPKRRRLDNAIS